ncbi:D-alanyl-D-alanine carboxypeptidase/D-alanyl-D-alanine-endopeptidase [Actinomadura sp. 9N407]|uniref:D-alanyl-D-alanine carboxypeptidase/D-alanyl-D-alanine endopeptidase n=1 Tax=Actinomadura sp. 9N407 TaxID=3375154 RepID=UPI0037A01675
MIMRRTLTALLGGTAVALATATPATATATVLSPNPSTNTGTATSLKADLDAILADERLAGAGVGVGVQVRDAGTGEVRYARGAATPLMPASNMKIHTSVAALAILGPDHRFRTSVHAREARGSTLAGNLYLKGTGDPTMRPAEYDRLAARVAAKGIERVTGDLIADDSWFDAQRTAPGWDPTDFPYAYAARISALTLSPDDAFNAGSIKVTVTPGKAGKRVKVALDPPTDLVKVDNRAVTGRAGGTSTLSVDRPAGADTIVLSGSYPAGADPVENLRTVEKPTLYAADVFRDALRKRGVKVAGTTRRGTTPDGTATLATRDSMPLAQLTAPFLKLSNNMIAEILVKSIGRETKGQGSWQAGLPVIERYLASQGVPAERLEMTDGSGLSRSNRTTPQDIGTVLKKAQSKTWFPAWYQALPIAGDPDPMTGGTLRNRMAKTPAAGNVHAKTGTLTGATALSGYVREPSGRRLIFSIVLNGYSGGAPKDIEDRIAVRLAGGTGAGARRATTTRQAPAIGPRLECSWTMTC